MRPPSENPEEIWHCGNQHKVDQIEDGNETTYIGNLLKDTNMQRSRRVALTGG